MRLYRLLSLLDALRLRHGPVTARQIAADCGISLRTAYRDIADLQAMGAPIRGEGGVGYVLDHGYFLPPLGLASDELEALALGAGLVAERGDATLAEAARRALAKIAGASHADRRSDLAEPIVSAGPQTLAVTAPHLGAMRQAIRSRHFADIDYVSLSGTASSRRARPLGLTLFDHAWLLTIWCESAQDFRHLRADRVTRFEIADQRFRHETGKRLSDSHRREGHAPFPARKTAGKTA